MNYDFIPDVPVVKIMNKNFQIQLKDSYLDLTNEIHNYKPEIFSKDLHNYFLQIPIEKINGFHSVVYHHSIELLNNGKYIEAKEIIESVINGKTTSDECIIKNNNIDDNILELIIKQATLGLEHLDITLEPIDEKSDLEAKKNLQYGLSILLKSDINLFNEISELVSSVVFFTSGKGKGNSKLFSLTSNSMQSLIMIEGKHDNSWIFLLDKYIHEGAHSLLFSLNLKEKFFYNSDDERYRSPLRKDLRPLPGIYHATFVIQRLIYAFSKIITLVCLSTNDKETIKKLLNFYLERVDDGYNTVMKYGKLSPLAKKIIEKGQSSIYVNNQCGAISNLVSMDT